MRERLLEGLLPVIRSGQDRPHAFSIDAGLVPTMRSVAKRTTFANNRVPRPATTFVARLRRAGDIAVTYLTKLQNLVWASSSNLELSLHGVQFTTL